jgi:transposase-like protein
VDVLLSTQRDARAARRFFGRVLATTQTEPVEVVTDRARAYPSVLHELLPAALHDAGQYANTTSMPTTVGCSRGCDRCAD